MEIGIRWMLKASTYRHEWIIVSKVGKKMVNEVPSTHQIGKLLGCPDWFAQQLFVMPDGSSIMNSMPRPKSGDALGT